MSIRKLSVGAVAAIQREWFRANFHLLACVALLNVFMEVERGFSFDLTIIFVRIFQKLVRMPWLDCGANKIDDSASFFAYRLHNWRTYSRLHCQPLRHTYNLHWLWLFPQDLSHAKQVLNANHLNLYGNVSWGQNKKRFRLVLMNAESQLNEFLTSIPADSLAAQHGHFIQRILARKVDSGELADVEEFRSRASTSGLIGGRTVVSNFWGIVFFVVDVRRFSVPQNIKLTQTNTSQMSVHYAFCVHFESIEQSGRQSAARRMLCSEYGATEGDTRQQGM